MRPRDGVALDTMHYEAYATAITNLIERFGDEFFQETAWDVIENNFEQLHTPEMNDPPGMYKPHADMTTFNRLEMDSARILVGESHPLPTSFMYGVINVLPLYGDIDFWKTLSDKYPAIYRELSERWLSLPDEDTHQNVPTKVHYKEAILHPRAVLRDLFPEAYQYLSKRDEHFIPPPDSVAVKIVGDRA